MFKQQLGLKLEGIKQAFPIAATAFIEWFKVSLVGFQKELVTQSNGKVEIPDITEEMVEKGADTILGYQLRALYEFFDIMGVYLSIGPPFKSDDWTWSITNSNDRDDIATSDGNCYKTRGEAEIAGFLRAFEELNNR